MKIFIAHPSAFDYQKKLYEPIGSSALMDEHKIILPHTRDGIWNTKEEIAACDVLVADVSAASTGAGVELGWADAFNVPIIAIHEKGTPEPPFIRYLTSTFIEYENAEDMLAKLNLALKAIK